MLPIQQVRSKIIDALRQGNRLVLAAPTGSGKTTQVPRYLYEDLDLAGRILVLEPRRIAARLMAKRVAMEMGSPLGQLVGYQTRHDSKISDQNVIRFMTEGLLLRLLQSDPTLSQAAVVVFDEFHERNLAGDAALAMLKQLQATTRPDLKILVMSATLDVQLMTDYLACPAIEAQGRMYDVTLKYQAQAVATTGGRPGSSRPRPIWDQAAGALEALLTAEPDGDVLMFLPGVYEIRRTIEACTQRCDQGRFGRLLILPLYSQLAPGAQEQAVEPAPYGVRKIVVATNVAETSLTIAGVRQVIDSGLARVNRYDARRGVNTLWVEPISMASAQQRAGRAGREGPGTCWRLWTEFEHKGHEARTTPEVRRLDLAQAVLWLSSLGVADVRNFDWLEPPVNGALDQALAVLEMLGAMDEHHTLTTTGRAMAGIPVHPRWGRMLVEAAERGGKNVLARAATWAAIASERDLLSRANGPAKARPSGEKDPAVRSDLEQLEALFVQAREAHFDAGRCGALGVNTMAARQVEATRQLLFEACEQAGLHVKHTRSAGTKREADDETGALIQCLLVAFVDHLAMRREAQGRLCAMVGGQKKACELSPQSAVDPDGLFVALDIRETGAGAGVKTVLGMVSAVEPDWLFTLYPDRVVDEKVTSWNAPQQAVMEVQQLRFDDLVFASTTRPARDLDASAALLAQKIAQDELRLEKWDDTVTQWIARTRSVAAWFPDQKLLAYDADDLLVIYQEICDGANRWNQVRDRPCLEKVKSALNWQDVQFVEKMAPARLALPGGWKMPLMYLDDGSPPKGRGKIQDFYDMTTTPVVAGGKVAVLLEILGPNYRPLQVTSDLAGFWQTLYPKLLPDLKRRYPRQKWR